MQYFWLIVIVSVLVIISLVFLWRQVQTLRWLRTQTELPPEDRRYYLYRSIRRIAGCVLLLVLAVMLAGLHTLGILDRLDQLVAQGEAARAKAADVGEQPKIELNQEERDFVRFCYNYVGTMALVIFVLLGVALADTMATRRYGMRQRKKLREDRQAMLARQLPLLRQEREGNGNGHGRL
jgi:hypothetical protein